MTPRKYLNSTEMARELGLPLNTFRTRRKAGMYAPDVQVGRGGAGTVYGWEPRRAQEHPAAPPPDDPALLPADAAALGDDFLVGPRMWAALSRRSLRTVQDQHEGSALRRREGNPQPWDMPEPDDVSGRSPRWTMASYRKWEEARGTLEEARQEWRRRGGVRKGRSGGEED
jgi:hypothetical protein